MLDQEETLNQLNIIDTHRQTLAYLLRQRAMLGDAYTPPGIWHDITKARQSIHSIKIVLRQQGVIVEDQSIDLDDIIVPYSCIGKPYKADQMVTLQ